jgi:hypothetical protein
VALAVGVGAVEMAVREAMVRPVSQAVMVPMRPGMDSVAGTAAPGDQVAMVGGGVMVVRVVVEGTLPRAQPVATLSSAHQIRGS